jgi:hypothetical protein
MLTRHIPTFLAAVATLPLLSTSARAPRTEPAPWQASTRLEEQMQELQSGFKGLENALAKEDAAKSLELLGAMETAVVAARAFEPAKAGELKDAAARQELVRGFRLKLIELQRGLLDVEAALVEGRVADARKLVDERLKPIKKSGHDAYKD